MCWICYDSGGDLVAPCKCTGSIRYVHRECIETWLQQSHTTHCPNCLEEIAVEEYALDPMCMVAAWVYFIVLFWFFTMDIYKSIN